MPAAKRSSGRAARSTLRRSAAPPSRTVIPTRGGNGAMEAIGDSFQPPRLSELESAVEYGLVDRRHAGVCRPLEHRALLRLWLLRAHRAARLRVMNREQRVRRCGVRVPVTASNSVCGLRLDCVSVRLRECFSRQSLPRLGKSFDVGKIFSRPEARLFLTQASRADERHLMISTTPRCRKCQSSNAGMTPLKATHEVNLHRLDPHWCVESGAPSDIALASRRRREAEDRLPSGESHVVR